MVIKLKKFGTTLISRPAGKEAYLAFAPTLRECGENEAIEVDFEGVEVLTPSWADEFLTPLFNSYKNSVSLKNTNNPSVVESLKILNHF
jgi:phosphorylcholine metabolism protein LicD